MSRRPDPGAIAGLPLDQQIAAIEEALAQRDTIAAEGLWERVSMGSLVALLIVFLPMPWPQRLILAAAAGAAVAKAWIRGSWRAEAMDKQDTLVAAMIAHVQDPDALPWLLQRGQVAAPKAQAAMWERAADIVRARHTADDLPWLLEHAQERPQPVREAAWQAIAAVVKTRRRVADLPWLLEHTQTSPEPVRDAAWETIAEVVRARNSAYDLPWLIDQAQRSPRIVREAAWETIAKAAPTAGAESLGHLSGEQLDWIASEMLRLIEALLVRTELDRARIAALIGFLARADHVQALPAMEDLAKPWRPAAIRSAAQAAVAHLQEVAAIRKRTETLLRPADAPAGETLLRPAEPVADAVLVRPVERESAP